VPPSARLPRRRARRFPIAPDQAGSVTSGERRALQRSDRLFGVFAWMWTPAILVLVAVEAITLGPDDRLRLIALTLGAASAAAMGALSVGRVPGAVGFGLVSAILDVVALAVALNTTTGNDAAIFLPFMGSVLLIPFVSGRRLGLAFAANWTLGVGASSAVFLLGSLRGFAGTEPPAVNIGTAAVMSGIGYGVLWWAGDRLAKALRAVRDAEERAVAAEAESRQAAHAREALIASSPVATFSLDADQRVVTWNAAAERLLGWSAAQVIGQSWRSLVPAEEAAAMEVRISRTRAGEIVWGERARWSRRDGSAAVVDLYLAAQHEPGDKLAALVGQLVDVAEREVLHARMAEVARLEALGQLAGGIAHDFNNLLTAVGGYAELLRTDASLDAARQADVDQIVGATHRGANLVRQLLAFSRSQPAADRVVELGRLLVGLETMFQRLIGAEVAIEIRVPSEPMLTRIDPAQAEQVVMNLAVNARDAMPQGGRLAISAGFVEVGAAGDDLVAGVDAGPYVEVTVADTGTGMDADTLARIFEPFFTTKPAGAGTGLGLATAFGIVRGCGGAIWAESTPGSGTTFHVLLPRVEAAPAGADGPAAAARPADEGHGETILVVDDEEPVREFVGRALVRLGYRVLAAESPPKALLLAASHHGEIDLLVTDVVMPEMRGPTLAASVHASRPSIRTLYMSGYTSDRAMLSQDPATRGTFIAKPFRVTELARAVREALDGPAR
jgi:two-component system, cell cycle sensor histidine kinase and response regulator CckA